MRKRPTLLRRLRTEIGYESVGEGELLDIPTLLRSRDWCEYRLAVQEARAFAERPPRREWSKSGIFLLLAYAAENLQDLTGWWGPPEDVSPDVGARFEEVASHASRIVDGYIGWGSRFTRLPASYQIEIRRELRNEDEWAAGFEFDGLSR